MPSGTDLVPSLGYRAAVWKLLTQIEIKVFLEQAKTLFDDINFDLTSSYFFPLSKQKKIL